MRKVLLTMSAATIALAAPLQAQGHGGGHGGGQGGGQGHGQAQDRHGGGGGGDHGNGGGNAHRGGGGDAQRGRGHEARAEARRPDRGGAVHVAEDPGRGHGRGHAEDRGRAVAHVRNEEVLRPGVRLDDHGRGRGHAEDRGRARLERRAALVTNPAEIERVRWEPARGLVNGCPPGLARRNNGCLPPGQARHLAERSFAGSLWPRYREGNYAYADGYLYKLAPSGAVQGFVPLAGGALWQGNPWPASYGYAPVPTYLSQYYGWNDPYDYRYADGVVYGLDPQTQMIQQVAGLLTGDQWNIGQAMPAGYDIYNVPYAYRGQYYDTPQSMYRYSDGYIYQMDPTTQLVQAAISLLS